MQVREAQESDVEAACAVLETAFGRPQEAQLFRALRESEDLAAALVAVGPVEDGAGPGVEGAPTPPGLLLDRPDPPARPQDAAADRRHVAGRRVVGVAVLSYLLSPKGAVGLGPLAVSRDCRDRGVGKALIGTCVERARHDGHRAIFVLGQPLYYTRFGFSVDAARPFRSEYPAEFMMALELEEGALSEGGELRYPPAYAGL